MSSKTQAIALLATSAIVTVAALDLVGRHAADEAVRHALAARPGLHVAAIDADPWLGRVRLDGVRAVSGRVSVTIGTLRLPLPRPTLGLVDSAAASPFDDDATKPESPPAPAPATPAPATPAPATPAPATPVPAAPAAPPAPSSGTATADDVVITSGPTTFRIKHIELNGTPLSNADLAAILDPKSPDSVADRLKKVTAASIVVPEIAADTVGPDHEAHWTERQILLANVVAGRVAAGSAAGMSLASKDPKSVTNGTVGAVAATGIDLAQLVRVFNTTRTDDAEPIVPLMDSVSIDGAKIEDVLDGTTLSIGPIKEAGFKGRPLKAETAAAGGDPDKAKAAIADVLSSFALASFETSKLVFHVEHDKYLFGIDSLALRDFGNGKLGDMRSGGFVFEGEGTKIHIGTAGFKGLGIPTGKADDQISMVGQTDLSDMLIDVVTPAKGTDAATDMHFAIKSFEAVGEPPTASGTNQGSMALKSLTFEVPPDSSGATLRDIGYSKLDLSAGGASSYDKAAQTLSLRDFNVSGVDMGTIHIGLDLANVSPALFSSNKDASKVAALAVLTKGLDLKLENAGLIEKLIAWRAKADGLRPEQERDQLADMAKVQIPAMANNAAAGKMIGDAVAKFIANPKTLHIAMSSKTGLGAADMALLSTPDALLDTLDVKASANE